MRIEHLIDGKAVASREYFETVNPATQEVLAEVASGGEAEINQAVAAAKQAFPAWAGLPATERAKAMRKLGELITQHVPEISQTETKDTGQTISQTGKQLVPRAADNFHYFAEMCTRVNGETYPTPTHLNYTLYHPVGVCALISPWNVPFMTATWKVAPALAFGNTVVLKMSELSPLTAARLGELALEAGIPAGVLNIVHGFGREAGEPLCRHPDIRAISFTGSTATGNRIVQSAGLKKFSMELGGKSPFVIFEDADLDRALDAAIFMIFSNNGERCTAGSRILVQKSIYADFAQKFAERARRIVVGDPLDEKTLVGPMISPEHLAKVRSYIELGSKEGATVLCGGLNTPDLPPALQKGNYTSNELPHFISNMEYAFPGNPELGQLLAEACNAEGVEVLAHPATTLAPEYGTLVPMRYMNTDQHFKVISVSSLCTVHYLNDSARLGWAMRKAVEEHYDGTVAFLASGSLSHRFAQNGQAPEFATKIWSPFLESLDHRVIEMWEAGDWETFCGMLPEYAAKGHGEGFMHDTAMLLGAMGWSEYKAPVEVLTPYFGASGTGQINAVFPVTPVSGKAVPNPLASTANPDNPLASRL